jgi:hypothetical protein
MTVSSGPRTYSVAGTSEVYFRADLQASRPAEDTITDTVDSLRERGELG